MIGKNIIGGKRTYLCEDCAAAARFGSYAEALAAGWVISRGRQKCYCPACAPSRRHVGRFGGKRDIGA